MEIHRLVLDNRNLYEILYLVKGWRLKIGKVDVGSQELNKSQSALSFREHSWVPVGAKLPYFGKQIKLDRSVLATEQAKLPMT